MKTDISDKILYIDELVNKMDLEIMKETTPWGERLANVLEEFQNIMATDNETWKNMRDIYEEKLKQKKLEERKERNRKYNREYQANMRRKIKETTG